MEPKSPDRHSALQSILDAVRANPSDIASILEAHTVALIAFDADRAITHANAAADVLFRYTRGGLVGQSTNVLLPERLRTPNAPPMMALADIMQVDLPGLRDDMTELRVGWVLGSAGRHFIAVLTDREQLDLAEERFRLLIDGVRGYAIFMLDASGMIASWNKGAERIKGWAASEIIGQPYEMFFTAEDRAAGLPAQLLATAARDEVHEVEGWRVRKNGERFRAGAYLAAMRSATGELYGFAKVTRDLTEKNFAQDLERKLELERAARAAAEETEDRLRRVQAISAALSEAVALPDIAAVILDDHLDALGAKGGVFWVLDRTGETFDLVAQRGHGKDYELTYGRLPLSAASPPTDAARLRRPEFYPTRDAIVERYPQYRSVVDSIGIKGIAALPLFAHGRLVGLLSIHLRTEHELTPGERTMFLTISELCGQAVERAQLFRAEIEARELAEAANRSKDQFLAMLGHELRNPLAPIVTALKLLPSERAREAIDRNVKHLVRLVDDLLDVSRITQQKVQLQKEPLELADVVERAIELTSPLVDERGQHLAVEVPRGLVMMGDPTRMAQVVGNLVNNAAKYSERGGHIQIAAHADGDRLELIVRDDGVGIDPSMLPTVFELFAQEQQSIDRSQGGLGLGLAIVRSIVAMHDGTVTAASAGRGAGSAFTITVPRLEGVTAVPLEPSQPLRAATSRKRILVVDDNTDAAELMAELFELGGHQTAVAHDGPSALEVAATFAPEVAILDIGLPVMDGYELARRLRDQHGAIHLIALTGYGQASDRERALAAGFNVHLVKPVDPTALRQAIADPP